MSMKQAALAFEEAAKRLSLAGEQLDESGWTAVVPPDPSVPTIHIGYIEETDDLALIAEIGLVPDDDPTLYRAFLESAYLFSGTQGSSFSVNPSSSKLTLQRVLPVERLTGEGLAEELTAFAETSVRARVRLVRKAEAEEDEDRDDMETEIGPASGIMP